MCLQGQLYAPGWAGIGFSMEGHGYPQSHPPQMINSTAVMGYFDASNNSQVPSQGQAGRGCKLPAAHATTANHCLFSGVCSLSDCLSTFGWLQTCMCCAASNEPCCCGAPGLGSSMQSAATNNAHEQTHALTVHDLLTVLQIGIYDLKAKNVMPIIPQRDGFTISNQTLEQSLDLHLIMRFRRAFDQDFQLNTVTVSPALHNFTPAFQADLAGPHYRALLPSSMHLQASELWCCHSCPVSAARHLQSLTPHRAGSLYSSSSGSSKVSQGRLQQPTHADMAELHRPGARRCLCRLEAIESFPSRP